MHWYFKPAEVDKQLSRPQLQWTVFRFPVQLSFINVHYIPGNKCPSEAAGDHAVILRMEGFLRWEAFYPGARLTYYYIFYNASVHGK